MSTPQRIHARTTITVNRQVADVLRAEAKKILVFGHELFEDFLDYVPEAQCVLATRFHDTCELITTLGWDPDTVNPDTTTVEVALTNDLIEQLEHRRFDLSATNLDLLDDAGDTIAPDLLAKVTTNRLAIGALNCVFGAYYKAIKN
jgi:hypothetical protein